MKALQKWIEVTGHFDHDTDGEFVFDCEMPEDGQEILVTLIGGDICRDICHIDKMGYRLESGWDWDDVFKWAPMPPAWWEENGISDLIDRQMLKADLLCGDDAEHDYCFPCKRILERIDNQPAARPEYKPVTAEDFAKTMSENTLYSFMAWYGKALELMEGQGFVICKKTM